jgi:hypothetical protein
MIKNKKFIDLTNGKVFEVIFVSSDQSEEQFNDYYGSMPW